MAMDVLYMLVLWSKVCYTGILIHWFRDHNAAIPNGTVTIGRTSFVGVGHGVGPDRASNVMYGMFS